MGYETVIDYLQTHPALAEEVGLLAPGRMICASQYWQRRQALGLFPYAFIS